MIYGVGIDLVEIKRIEKLLETNFLKRFFGLEEQNELKEKKFCPLSVAAAFAVKEAFSKAIGTGIKGFSLDEVQTLHDNEGKPYLTLSGNALKIAKEKSLIFNVSISHEKKYATAIVIAEKSGETICM